MSRHAFLLSIGFAFLCHLVAGCAGTAGVGPTSGSWVSVSIENSTLEKVRSSVTAVFNENGFKLIQDSGNMLKFRKWGGTSTQVVYGSFLSDGVQIRPEIIITSQGGGRFRIHCDVYMHENRGGSQVDTNWKLMVSGRSGYQKLLNESKRRAEKP